MRRFWYFDVSLWSVDKKSCLSKLSNKCVFTPYCKDWEPIYPLNTFVRLRFPWIQLRFPQTPPNIPLITPWHLCGTWHANRRQQTLPKTPRNWQVLFEKVWQCFLASVVVCWHFMFPGDIWWVSGRSLRGVWRYLSGIHGHWRSLNKFGGYMRSQSTVWSENTILAQPWMVRFFVNWPYWDIKIPKPPHISFPKMIGLCHFLWFLGSPEKNYL